MEKRKFPASQREALRQGVTYYFTGKPCKHGHIVERFASNKNCCECVRIRNRSRTEAKDYWIGYGDEAYRDRKRQYAKSYYQRHKHEHREGVRKRRSFEKSASVATKKGITELRRIKLEAQMLSIDTGVKHEVDHIIPLIHKKICGLNVPVNVQILTKQKNRAKASRLCTKTQEKELMEMLKKKP
jgi:hypothetical protein